MTTPHEFDNTLTDARALVDASMEHPSVARVYDYLLGGNHNFAVDREFAEQQRKILPDLRASLIANRAFLARAVRAAIQLGIRQFVDIGSGLPTVGNVHEIADAAAPGKSRVVYIDNEPIAHAHATSLLADTADTTRHHALNADFLNSVNLWQQVLDSGYINPAEPICLLTVALLHFLPPDLHPEQHLAFYRDQLPAGSLLALSHGCNERQDPNFEQVRANYDRDTNHRAHFRTRAEITDLFGDFELLSPGVVWAPEWRPDGSAGIPDEVSEDPARSGFLVGIAHKT